MAKPRDRRSATSRLNLGDHVQQPLSPEGTRIVCARLPVSAHERLARDADAAGLTLAEHVRRLLGVFPPGE